MNDEFKSSPEEFYSFMKTSIYHDFINELNIRIKALTDELIDDEQEHAGRSYDLFRGGLKNMKQMKDIFNDMALAKEADMREGEKYAD